jgi:hypothetical protein
MGFFLSIMRIRGRYYGVFLVNKLSYFNRLKYQTLAHPLHFLFLRVTDVL